MRIAIADDEADIRQYFGRLLPRLGHDVVGQAKNGHELIELCRTERPDLVITDILMPEMGGLEAASEIGKAHNIPIIIVSSHDPPEHDGNAEIIAFLVKPIRISDLEAAIAKAQRTA